MNTRKQEYP